MTRAIQQRTVHGALVGIIRAFCEHEHVPMPAQCLQYNVNERVPFSVWLEMLAEIATHDTRPALGLAIAQYAQLPHAGVLSYLALSCKTFADAALRYFKFHRISYDGNDFSIVIHNEQIELKWNFDTTEPGLTADETAIAVFWRLISQAVAPNSFKLNKVVFVHPAPAKTQIYKDFFGCPVVFSGDNMAMWFNLSQINLPMPRQDDVLREILEAQANALYAELPNYDTFDALLQEVLIKSVQYATMDIDSVAAKLGMNARGLQRRLSQKGYTFLDRLNQVRCTLAKGYLKNNALNLAEIALLLGYSEQSAFQRAFRQWTGVTPLQYRKQLE